jgi:hypothetical protein
MELPPHLTNVPSFGGNELAGTPYEFALEFRWFDQAALADFDVRPNSLGELLTRPLPTGVPTVVNVG